MGDRRKCRTFTASPAEPGGLPVMLVEGFSRFVTSMTSPMLPAGAVVGWGLHRLESAAMHGAHPFQTLVWAAVSA
jgi:hypothetical protein